MEEVVLREGRACGLGCWTLGASWAMFGGVGEVAAWHGRCRTLQGPLQAGERVLELVAGFECGPGGCEVVNGTDSLSHGRGMNKGQGRRMRGTPSPRRPSHSHHLRLPSPPPTTPCFHHHHRPPVVCSTARKRPPSSRPLHRLTKPSDASPPADEIKTCDTVGCVAALHADPSATRALQHPSFTLCDPRVHVRIVILTCLSSIPPRQVRAAVQHDPEPAAQHSDLTTLHVFLRSKPVL